MRYQILFLLLFIAGSSVNAQIDPDSILIENNKLPEVLLVGTFHFAYYDEDNYKTSEDQRVDILSATRQQEVVELVNYIAHFKPNKIFVEDFNKDNALMMNYRNYQNGRYNLTADEIDQVAYRLMDRFDLDTLYGVDANSIGNEMKTNVNTKEFYKPIDQARGGSKVMNDRYNTWYKRDDEYLSKNKLLDYLKLLNSEKYAKRGFYSHFISSFKSDQIEGADKLTLDLINRNIRILHKIEQNITSENDRILVLFGSTHTEFFKVFFDSSPEHELVSFDSLDKLSQ